MDEVVTENQCLICRRWKPADRPSGRSEYFSPDATDRILLIPVHDICPACERAHQAWKIAVTRH